LILLDVLMPDMDGWTVYQQLRQFTEAPVCFTTALSEDQDVFHGLDLGAEDYIIKPYSFKDLLGRVRAAIHRSERTAQSGPLEIGPLRIDVNSHRVWLNERPIHLTPREFQLLAILARQPDQAVSHEDLVKQIWGAHDAEAQGNLKIYIWYLRQKLEDDPNNPQLIVSVRGVGYRLNAPKGRDNP
jgi:two-component system KDP operon response regulator KdpE